MGGKSRLSVETIGVPDTCTDDVAPLPGGENCTGVGLLIPSLVSALEEKEVGLIPGCQAARSAEQALWCLHPCDAYKKGLWSIWAAAGSSGWRRRLGQEQGLCPCLG